MCEIWNELELKKPPVVTVNGINTIKVQRVRNAIGSYIQQCGETEKEFAQTAALLSRLMARRKNSFRRMIVFKNIQKLNSANCRLLIIDLKRDLNSFFAALPDNFEEINSNVELPTCNSLEYVLVRVLTVHGIYQRIRECCLESADATKRTMQSNFFMDINTLLLAVFAKLYNLSGVLGNKCVDLYACLQQQRKHFPIQNNFKFLPTGTILPEPNQLQRFDLKLQEEVACGSADGLTSVTFNTQVSTIDTPKKTKSIIVNKLNQKVDLGTEIRREEIRKISNKKAPKIDVSQLKTLEEVRKFIVLQQKERKTSIESSATHTIANHEWTGAVKLFERKLLKEGQTRAINFFCKFLSSKI